MFSFIYLFHTNTRKNIRKKRAHPLGCAFAGAAALLVTAWLRLCGLSSAERVSFNAHTRGGSFRLANRQQTDNRKQNTHISKV